MTQASNIELSNSGREVDYEIDEKESPYEIIYMKGDNALTNSHLVRLEDHAAKESQGNHTEEAEEIEAKVQIKDPHEDEDERLLKENRELINRLKQLDEPHQRQLKTEKSFEEDRKDQPSLFYKLGYFVPVINHVLQFNGLEKTNSSLKANIVWNPKMKDLELFVKIPAHQKVNHFPCSVQLGRKDCLNKNIFHMQTKFSKDFNFLPRSYILPQEEPVLLDVVFV